jgi:hypothetical protein
LGSFAPDFAPPGDIPTPPDVPARLGSFTPDFRRPSWRAAMQIERLSDVESIVWGRRLASFAPIWDGPTVGTGLRNLNDRLGAIGFVRALFRAFELRSN